MNDREKKCFKKDYLLQDLINDHLNFDALSIMGQPGSTWTYIKRFAQRRPQHVKDAGKRMGTKNNKKVTINSLRKEKQKKDEADKHMTKSDKALDGQEVQAEDMLKTWETCNVDVDVDEDADIGTLIDILNTYNTNLFDDKEKEALKMLGKDNDIAYPRQLGCWIGLEINGKDETVTCIDERCCFGGTCEYRVTLRSYSLKSYHRMASDVGSPQRRSTGRILLTEQSKQ